MSTSAPPSSDQAEGSGAGSTTCAVAEPLSDTTTLTPGSPGDAATVDPDGVGLVIGMSNARLLSKPLRELSPFPWVSAAAGGADSEQWATDPRDRRWPDAHEKLEREGYVADDVEVVLIYLAKITPAESADDPAFITAFENEMLQILDRLPSEFPRAELVFIQPRETGRFSRGNDKNGEPVSFRSGEAELRIVDRYDGPLRLVVGPYLWDDQVCLRGDGLRMTREMFLGDGVHPNNIGQEYLGGFMHDYFLRHPSSRSWYSGG